MSNKQYLDQTIRRLVQLESLKQSEIDKFKPHLKNIDKLIKKLLLDDELAALTAKEFNVAMQSVKQQIAAEITVYTGALHSTAVATAIDSYVFEGKSIRAAFEAVTLSNKVDLATTEKRLAKAVSDTPLAVKGSEGRTITNLFDELNNNESNRYINHIKLARYEGKTNQQIIQTIRGTRRNGYKDGLMEVTARQAQTIVRTTVQHAAMQGKLEFSEQNSDIIEGERLLVTLDGRTSSTCRALSGEEWELGKGPRPPLHHNCRSSITYILKSEFRGKGNSTRRASMNGYTDNVTYYEWLKSQPKSFQEDTIGIARTKLLRSGGLSSDEFAKLQLNKNFKPLTLEQMRQREPMAFERAGI